jgi:hypothetical protein
MFSYLFSASKKPVAEAVLEPVTESVPEKNLEADGLSPNHKSCSLEQATLSPLGRGSIAENEQLKAQIQTLLAEKAELEKTIKNLRRDSEVYRDLMFTKICTCNN